MIITNCPRCGAMNATTTCNKCGWSQFNKSTVSTGVLLDDYKRLLLENRNLKERIAELEAEVAELKPYRDGYDPEEAFPPEGEWVWLRDCDDNIEIMGYSQKEKCYWNYEGSRMPDDGDIVRWYPIGKLPEEREE